MMAGMTTNVPRRLTADYLQGLSGLEFHELAAALYKTHPDRLLLFQERTRREQAAFVAIMMVRVTLAIAGLAHAPVKLTAAMRRVLTAAAANDAQHGLLGRCQDRVMATMLAMGLVERCWINPTTYQMIITDRGREAVGANNG